MPMLARFLFGAKYGLLWSALVCPSLLAMWIHFGTGWREVGGQTVLEFLAFYAPWAFAVPVARGLAAIFSPSEYNADPRFLLPEQMPARLLHAAIWPVAAIASIFAAFLVIAGLSGDEWLADGNIREAATWAFMVAPSALAASLWAFFFQPPSRN